MRQGKSLPLISSRDDMIASLTSCIEEERLGRGIARTAKALYQKPGLKNANSRSTKKATEKVLPTNEETTDGESIGSSDRVPSDEDGLEQNDEPEPPPKKRRIAYRGTA